MSTVSDALTVVQIIKALIDLCRAENREPTEAEQQAVRDALDREKAETVAVLTAIAEQGE